MAPRRLGQDWKETNVWGVVPLCSLTSFTKNMGYHQESQNEEQEKVFTPSCWTAGSWSSKVKLSWEAVYPVPADPGWHLSALAPDDLQAKDVFRGYRSTKERILQKPSWKMKLKDFFFSSSNQNPNIGFSHYVHFPQTFLKIFSYIKRKGISTPSGMGIPSKLTALRVAEQEHAT